EPERGARRRPRDRGMRPQGPSRRRRARVAASRELHRERGRRDVRRLPRADGRGAEAGLRAFRRRARARGAVPRAARAAAAPRGRGAGGELRRVRGARWTAVRIAALPPRDALPAVGQLIPSLRSVVVGLLILAGAVGAYVVAWDTPLFAVRTLDVRGGTPQLRAEARAALREEEGRSLLRVGGGAIDAQLRAIPEIRGFTYDRAFPHTLRVVLRREVPVLVVRRVPGPDAVLVAASGKVLRVLAHPRLSHLPRLWVEKQVPISVAERLPQPIAGAAAAL